MDRDEFMELVYETFADEPDNVLANGIIEAADAYAEHEKAQLFSEGTTSDLISRQAAIDEINHICPVDTEYDCTLLDRVDVRCVLSDLPTIQHEPKEGHWIPHETPDGGEQYECSRCGVLWEFTEGTPEDNEAYFCPKCGTKMKGERQK